MSVLSLAKSVRSCRTDVGWANKLQSDRFLNPCQVVCPVWNGTDQYGRIVSPDSYMIETSGCRSALDRVDVENYQRPQYFELVNLDGYGINSGNLYSEDAGNRTASLQNLSEIVGNPGFDYGAQVRARCPADRDAQHQYESRFSCR
jgi:hypothetical protein